MDLSAYYLGLCMRACTHAAKKLRNVRNNVVIKCVIRALYMYLKKLSFSGFSHPVEPEIWIFLHHNMSPCIRLNLRP